MKPIYGLVISIPEQHDIISKHCFKTCGKIIVGGIVDKELGELAVCRIAKEQCPQFDRELDEPIGEVNGDPLFIRKLKMETNP